MTDRTSLPSYAELRNRPGAPDGSSWRLWGDSDTRGTLNLIDRRATLRGLAEAREGLVVSLNASLTVFDPPLFGRAPLSHEITAHSKDRVRDEVLSNFNTQASSQWDGLRHVRSLAHGFYNGLSEDQLGIDAWAGPGIVSRGLLLDVERWYAHRGTPVPYNEPFPIEVEDLHAMIAGLSTEVLPGDILVLHTGWLDHQRATGGPINRMTFAAPGLRPGQDTLSVIWDTHCGAIAADNPSLEVWPPTTFVDAETRRINGVDPAIDAKIFMHYQLIAMLGVAVGELWDTGRLAAECRARGRDSFLLASSPANLPGGVASPANALAVL